MNSILKTVPFILSVALLGCNSDSSGDSQINTSPDGFSIQAPLKMGVDVPYEPFAFTNSTGELEGMEIQLGNELCKKLTGADCEWVVTPWNGIISALQAGDFDVIFSSMSITESRLEVINFSDPYYRTPATFVKKNTNQFDALNPGENKVAVVAGTVSASYLTSLGGYTIESYDSFESAQQALADNSVAAIYEFANVLYDQFTLSGGEYVQEGPFHFSDALGRGVGAGVVKSNTQLLNSINEALVDLWNDGTYVAIAEQYFGFPLQATSN